jgi:hypothetical protein
MRRQIHLLTITFAATVILAEAQENPDLCLYKAWRGRFQEVENLLRTTEIRDFEPIGHGVTSPWRITLWDGGKQFYAAYKPIKEDRYSGYWESHQAEVAAYELDKMLGLNKVPPTVVRRINDIPAENDKGSLQLWVEDCQFYRDVQDKTPRRPSWSYEISRMKMFDVLINNEDRNERNFFVCPDFHIILIDHSRAFITTDDMLKEPKKFPVFYDRKLVEKLKGLTRENLDAGLKSVPFEEGSIRLLKDSQIEAILKRRDALLAHLRKLIEERGEFAVLFN